jgi:hypothetical protein
MCSSHLLPRCILELLDTSQQWLDTFDFSIRGQSIPCSQFHQDRWHQMGQAHIYRIQQLFGP